LTSSPFAVAVIFLGGLILAILIPSVMFIDSPWFVEILGFFALGIEACLGTPQLYQNYQKRSTAGLSYEMIASWAVGDLFKTLYFIYSGAPLQFILCGAVQLTVDAAITYQIMTYDNKPTL
jgi:solute carrier family 66, member 2